MGHYKRSFERCPKNQEKKEQIGAAWVLKMDIIVSNMKKSCLKVNSQQEVHYMSLLSVLIEASLTVLGEIS